MKALLIKKTKEIPATSVKKEYVRFDFEEVNINGLDDMQEAVEGTIEGWNCIPELIKNSIVLYCNDEGKLLNMLPAVIVLGRAVGKSVEERKIIEQLCGNILLCGYDFESDRSVDLSETQMEIIRRVFRKAFYYTDTLNIDGFAVEVEVADNA